MRILLVEDDRSLSRAVSTILQKNNYSVDCVENGQTALDYLEKDIYDAGNGWNYSFKEFKKMWQQHSGSYAYCKD